MFEAQFSTSESFRHIIDIIKEFFTTCNFHCSESGIEIKTMDQNHVSLVHMVLPANSFRHYVCHRNRTLGINLTSIGKILKSGLSSMRLTLSASDNEDVLSILLEDPKGDVTSQFELKLMSIEEDCLEIPEVAPDAIIVVEAAALKDTCQHLGMLSDIVFKASGEIANGTITFHDKENAANDNNKNKLKKKGSGDVTNGKENDGDGDEDDNNNNNAATDGGDGADESDAKTKKRARSASSGTASTRIYCKGLINQTYAYKCLASVTKATSISPCVKICLKEDTPIKLRYTIPMPGEKNGFFHFYIAPKVADEE